MSTIITISVVVLIALIIQIALSQTKSKWPGLIIPLTILILTTFAFAYYIKVDYKDIHQFNQFLIENKSKGLFALFLRSSFLYSPFFITLGIYLVSRIKKSHKENNQKNHKEIEKMIINDLS